MPENQDILSISFDYKRTETEAGKVLAALNPILDIVDRLNNSKLELSNLNAGLAQSKKGVDNGTQALKDGEKALKSYSDETKKTGKSVGELVSAYDKLKGEFKAASIEAKNLAAEFGADSVQAIKAAESADLLRKRIKEIEDLSTGKTFAEREKALKRLADEQDKIAKKKKDDDEAELKRINELQAAETKRSIARQEKQIANNQPVPFTTNLNADGTVIEPKAAKTTGQIVTNIERAQVEGILTAKEYAAAQKEVSASFVEENNNAKKYIVTEKEKQAALAQDKYIYQQNAAALKNQIREEINVKGSLEQRRAALIRLTSTYDRLSAAERSSGYGQRLQSTILGLTDQVKGLEAQTGRAQRNVGNYGNAITKAFSGAFGYIRQIAYILPGVGIAGILGAISDVVIDLVSALFKGKESLNTFAENYKNVVDVIGTANKSAGKQTADLKILYEAATNVNLSMKERVAAAHALKKEFPDEFANTTALAIVNGQAAAAYKATAQSIIDVARATAAKSKIDELETQRLDAAFQKQKIINATNAEQKRALAEGDKTNAVDEFGRNIKADPRIAQEAITNRRLKALREQENKERSIDEQEKFLTSFIGEKKITDVVIKEQNKRAKEVKEARTKTNKTDYNDDLIKATQESNKLLLQTQIDLNKSIVENDKYTYSQRESALLATQDLERKLLYLNYSDQVEINREKRENDLQSANLSIEQKKAIKQAELIEERNLELKYTTDLQKMKLDQSKALQDFELKDIEKQRTTRFITIEERQKQEYEENQQRIKSRLDADTFFNERIATIDATNSAKEQQALLERYNEGKITREEYEQELLDIQIRYAQKGLEIQIQTIEDELKTVQLDYDTRIKLEKQLADLKLKLSEETQKRSKANTDQIVSDLQAFQKGLNDVADVLGGFINIGVTKQKNALQELEDQQQKNYQNEIDRINSSTLTQQQKADQIKILEAQRQAQKEAFDRKNREADLKKAKFDKAVGIANIILNTAIAVTKVLYNPFLAALAGALGAAQLAVAIATPLPKYATGLKDAKKDHVGIVGEAGPEIVERPGFKTELVQKETVMYLPKGSNVKPIGRDELNNYMYRSMHSQTAKVIQMNAGNDRSDRLLEELLKETRKSNSRKNTFQFNFKHDPSWSAYRNKYYS